MGLALEWMGAVEREMLAKNLLPEWKNGKKNDVWASCPFHSENTPSFHYFYGRDMYKCFGCGASGDLISLWSHIKYPGLDPKEAFLLFKREFGPVEDGKPRPRRRPAPVRAETAVWTPGEVLEPPALWSERAELFVEHSMERLLKNRAQLDYLAGRGLSLDVIRRCRIGWNDNPYKAPPFAAWGLEGGPEDRIWLADGIVVPFYSGGRVVKIKIRRGKEAKPRFCLVRGSSVSYHAYGRLAEGCGKVMVLESELDAAMMWGLYGNQDWLFLAAGSTSCYPSTRVDGLLKSARLLAVSLDSDGAGMAAYKNFWRREYPQSVFWPVPREWGKDVGEAVANGIDLLGWLWTLEARAAGGGLWPAER